MQEQEKKILKEKQEKSKRQWDNRILQNDKMRQLCKDLITPPESSAMDNSDIPKVKK